MNADGGNTHDVSPNANCAAYPSFSPDGKTFAFVQYPDVSCDGAPDIWLMGADGTNPHAITNTPGDRELQPRWAPDGRHLVFASHTAAPHTRSRCTRSRSDGSARTQLTPFSLGATFPDWSPNGQYIAFGSHADQPNSSVYVYPVRTGEIAQVTIAAPDTDDTAPRFGPDSRHIVFTSSAQLRGDDLDLLRPAVAAAAARRARPAGDRHHEHVRRGRVLLGVDRVRLIPAGPGQRFWW